MKKILVVVDMQNDFIDAALGTAEAVAIVPAVKEKILSYPPENVIATMDTHGEDYMDTQEGKNLPVVHCIKGTDGWQIRPDIAELLTKAKIYEKPTFGSIALASDLKAMSEEEEIEYGYLRSFQCVAAEGFDAGSADIRGRCLLCRCDAGETPGRAGDNAFLSDSGEERMI